MQADKTATTTECLKQFANFNSISTQVQNFGSDRNAYNSQLKTKGKASAGTDAGFWIATISKYTDVVTKGFDVYNGCKIDYLFTGLGKQLTTVTGGAGLASNLIGIFMADLAGTASTTTSTANQSTTSKTTTTSVLKFSDLNNALATHNAYKVG